VANESKLLRNGAVGFIEWLGLFMVPCETDQSPRKRLPARVGNKVAASASKLP